MLQKNNIRWALLILANVVVWCVLGLHSRGEAAPQGGQQPFANAVQQRGEMVKQLQSINSLLKEQNTLLQSGKLTVVVVEPAKE